MLNVTFSWASAGTAQIAMAIARATPWNGFSMRIRSSSLGRCTESVGANDVGERADPGNRCRDRVAVFEIDAATHPHARRRPGRDDIARLQRNDRRQIRDLL